MKRSGFVISFFVMVLYCSFFPEEKQSHDFLYNESGNKINKIRAGRFFKETKIIDKLKIRQKNLLNQVNEVLKYYNKYENSGEKGLDPGILRNLEISFQDLQATLIFLKKIIIEDLKKGAASRLKDPGFINHYFRVIRWFPFSQKRKERIRVTKYAVFTVEGKTARQGDFNHALYSLPEDEKHLSKEQAEIIKHRLSRFRYTKQDVMAGVYHKGGAEPLVWLTRESLDSALLQGSIRVKFQNEEKRFYNVSRNNGIPFNPEIRDPGKQARYWYFSEVKSPRGYGNDYLSQIGIFPGVCLAGDVHNLAFGLLLCMEPDSPHTDRSFIGIMADTGGAFIPNLSQLDLYAGQYNTFTEFRNSIKKMPAYYKTYILIKK